MLYAGIYERLAKLRFQIIFGTRGTSIMLFEYDDKDFDETLATAELTGRIPSALYDKIVVHAITNLQGKIRAFHGDKEIATKFLEDLNTVCDGTRVEDKEYMWGSTFEKNGARISVIQCNDAYNSVKKINKLSYEEVHQDEKISSYVKVHQVRSLAQLKEIYDLSWILNEDGSLKRDYRCVTTKLEYAWILDNIKTHDVISFDLETTGTEIYYRGEPGNKDYIVGICLAWQKGQAFYIPLESYKFETLDRDYVIDTLFPLLAERKIEGANLMFDIRCAYDRGYLFTCDFDTMQAEFDLDPTGSRGHKSLKAMTRYYLNEETLELSEVLGGPVDGRLIPYLDKDVITIYGCADAEYVIRLREVLEPELEFMKAAWQYDMKMITVCAVSEYYGTKVNMDLLKPLSDINKKDLESITATIHAYLDSKVRYDLAVQVLKRYYTVENMPQEMIHEVMQADEIKDKANMMLTKEAGPARNRIRVPLNIASTKDLDYILHGLLHFPENPNKNNRTEHNDKYFQQILSRHTDTPDTFLKSDIMSDIVNYNFDWVHDEDKVLISKQEFESLQYPFALLLMVWRKLSKRQNSFFQRLEDGEVDGWYNTDNNMTAADTARIINVAQTLQGYMKRLITKYDDSRYFIIFDAAQIEFRVMIGLAAQYWKQMLNSIEADANAKADVYIDSLVAKAQAKNKPELISRIQNNRAQLRREYNAKLYESALFSRDISYLIDKLNIPWADYHREGGCLLVGTTPAQMTKAQRSTVKGPHFAIPYGGEAPTIAEPRLKGVLDPKKRERIIEEVEIVLDAWRDKMYALYRFLETKRDEALTEVTDPKKLPPRLREHGKWGMVTNACGRHRFYDLDYEEIARRIAMADGTYPISFNETSPGWSTYVKQVQRRQQGSIRRSAGNYPIQSLAREFFVKMMVSLFKACKEKGYSGQGAGKDKVIQELFIHDENHVEVDKSIHPFEMYSLIYDNCMLKIKGFPRIYCGISIVDNWYEGKDDLYEAPVEFVEDMIKAYKANPEKYLAEDYKTNTKEYILKYMTAWMHEYAVKFITKWTDSDGVFDLVRFRKENDNYFVYTKLGLYTKKFTNKEDDISKEELIILAHNENPALKVNTGKRVISMSEYVFEYPEKKQVEKKPDVQGNTALFVDDANNTELAGLDALDSLDELDNFTAEDLDILGVSIDDDLEREEDAADCYWLYDEAERTFNDVGVSSFYIESEASEENEHTKPVFTGLMNIDHNWVLDVSKHKPEMIYELKTCLAPWLSTSPSSGGMPLYIKDKSGKATESSLFLRDGFDMQTVEDIMTGNLT